VFCYILIVQNVVYVLCINFRGHTQRFELSKCSKTHRGLPRIVMVVKLFLKHSVYKVYVHVMGSHDVYIHFIYLAYANQIGLMMARQWAETCRHLHLNVIYLLVELDEVYLLI
jgi:hypothetical protein